MSGYSYPMFTPMCAASNNDTPFCRSAHAVTCVCVCVCSLARDQYESVMRQVEASAARDRRERLAACDTAARYTDVAHALWQAANLHH